MSCILDELTCNKNNFKRDMLNNRIFAANFKNL